MASKQMGRRENKIINIEGRVQFDLLQVIDSYLFCCCVSSKSFRRTCSKIEKTSNEEFIIKVIIESCFIFVSTLMEK